MAESVNEPQARSECAKKAYDLLALRPHFRRQLEDKLSSRGFDSPIVREVCDELEERGYLNDLECARGLAEGGLRRKGYGPRRVRAELLRRGARETVVEEVVAAAFAEGEAAALRAAASKWLRGRRWDRRRLAGHLQRKGFSSGAIVSALESLESEHAGRGSSGFE